LGHLNRDNIYSSPTHVWQKAPVFPEPISDPQAGSMQKYTFHVNGQPDPLCAIGVWVALENFPREGNPCNCPQIKALYLHFERDIWVLSCRACPSPP